MTGPTGVDDCGADRVSCGQVNSPSLLAEETGRLAAIDLILAMIGRSSSAGSLSRLRAFFSSRIITLFVHFSRASSTGAYHVRAISNPRVFSFAVRTLTEGFVVDGIFCTTQYCRVDLTLYHSPTRIVIAAPAGKVLTVRRSRKLDFTIHQL